MLVSWAQVVAVHWKRKGKTRFILEVELTDLVVDWIIGT